MFMQATNQFAQYQVPGWRAVQKLVGQFMNSSAVDVSMRGGSSALAAHGNQHSVSTRAAQPTRVTMRSGPLTDAEIEALELAIRQGSINASAI